MDGIASYRSRLGIGLGRLGRLGLDEGSPSPSGSECLGLGSEPGAPDPESGCGLGWLGWLGTVGKSPSPSGSEWLGLCSEPGAPGPESG